MGNLLSYKESFNWHDAALNRNVWIEDLSIAFNQAQQFADSIFYSPSLYDFTQPWGQLFEKLWDCFPDYDRFKQHFPWISQAAYQALIHFPDFFHKTTPNGAENYENLNFEFLEDNNSLLGLLDNTCVNPLVFDEDSWREFHKRYVSKFPYHERVNRSDYFLEFFEGKLMVSANQIMEGIESGQYSHFTRIEVPKIFGDKLHIHFDDDNALNIDGTWRHREDNFVISMEAREILSFLGFKLPPEYYNI